MVAVATALFRCLLLLLREREALRLFPACLAFLSVISALAVSHKPQHSAFRRRFLSYLFPSRSISAGQANKRIEKAPIWTNVYVYEEHVWDSSVTAAVSAAM